MAKITHKGSWIKIGSLNKEDKKNYLISLSLFALGALFWGIHLTTVDDIFGPAIENSSSPLYTIIRILIFICWALAAVYFSKFLKTQDELMHRYYYYIGAWGGIGFVVFGMFISIIDAYINMAFGFYSYFVAYTLGTFIGGYMFDWKYLRDGDEE